MLRKLIMMAAAAGIAVLSSGAGTQSAAVASTLPTHAAIAAAGGSAAGFTTQGIRPAKPAIAANAFSCNAGDLCVYSGLDGTGSRCSWTNADNDWTAGSVQCSWIKAGTKVQSFWNRGTNTGFTGVNVYLSPNFQNPWFCARQGTQWDVTAGGVLLKSHQWTSGSC